MNTNRIAFRPSRALEPHYTLCHTADYPMRYNSAVRRTRLSRGFEGNNDRRCYSTNPWRQSSFRYVMIGVVLGSSLTGSAVYLLWKNSTVGQMVQAGNRKLESAKAFFNRKRHKSDKRLLTPKRAIKVMQLVTALYLLRNPILGPFGDVFLDELENLEKSHGIELLSVVEEMLENLQTAATANLPSEESAAQAWAAIQRSWRKFEDLRHGKEFGYATSQLQLGPMSKAFMELTRYISSSTSNPHFEQMWKGGLRSFIIEPLDLQSRKDTARLVQFIRDTSSCLRQFLDDASKDVKGLPRAPLSGDHRPIEFSEEDINAGDPEEFWRKVEEYTRARTRKNALMKYVEKVRNGDKVSEKND